MNFNRKPPKQPNLPLDHSGRPTVLETRTHAEFTAMIARHEAGEFRLLDLERATGTMSDGYLAGNGSWLFHVRWKNPVDSLGGVG